MEILRKSEAISKLLVGDCPNIMAQLKKSTYTVFATISPNPGTKHKVIRKINGKKIEMEMRYDRLPHKQQYEYCMKIIREVYLNGLENPVIIGTQELNDSKNVHFHFLLMDPFIKNDNYLAVYRRDIANHPEILKNSKGKKDYMNNIVKLTKSLNEIIMYMDKEKDKIIDLLPNYYSKTIIKDIPNVVHVPRHKTENIQKSKEQESQDSSDDISEYSNLMDKLKF